MSCILTCEELYGMDIESIIKGLVVIDDNGCLALRSTASGGGGYTFPSNSGNTAYVSSGGNDGTGVVGNISKPFLTANAAIAALNNAVDGALIILSSTSQIDITDYDTTSYPYSLTITNFSYQNISVESSGSFGLLTVKTPAQFIIDTRTIFTIDDTFNLDCDTFTVAATSVGAINMTGTIKCNVLNLPTNANVTVSADVVEWSKLATVGTISFTYNICPPRQWKAKISQVDTGAPTIDIVFRNDYGETFTTAYNTIGQYQILSAGNKFSFAKTNVVMGAQNTETAGQIGLISIGTVDLGDIDIFTYDGFAASSDNIISDQTVIIETYL